MKQNEIIEMARQSGFILEQPSLDTWCALGKEFEAFAKLVAAKEREACALIEEKLAFSPAMFSTMAEYRAYRDGVLSYREAIRARGEA